MLVPVVRPAVEPISLDVAKAHCKVEDTVDDALIAGFVGGARGLVEAWQRRALISQTWDWFCDGFPPFADRRDRAPAIRIWDSPYGRLDLPAIADEFVLPLPPLIEIVSIRYRPDGGDLVTLDPSAYEVFAGAPDRPGLVIPAFGASWPAAPCRMGSVVVRFRCGYGDDATALPPATIAAVQLVTGTLYRNRDAEAQGVMVDDFPAVVGRLVRAESWGPYP